MYSLLIPYIIPEFIMFSDVDIKTNKSNIRWGVNKGNNTPLALAPLGFCLCGVFWEFTPFVGVFSLILLQYRENDDLFIETQWRHNPTN